MTTNLDYFKIYQEYLQGNSIDKLQEKYHTVLSKKFKELGYKIYSPSEFRMLYRRNDIKLNWFCDTIDTHEKAYITGLFMADGYVGKTQVGLRLKDSDKELIKKVKDYFSPDITLQNYKGSYSFVVSSKIVCNNLRNLGVVSHKTYNQLHIPQMPLDLISSFIRGYFDGDGSIFIATTNKTYKTFRCSICSPTEDILLEIQQYLKKEGINSRINKEIRKDKILTVPNKCGYCIGNVDMYRLFINSKKDVEMFYNYIYKDKSMYLQRKFDKFNNNKQYFQYKRHVNTEVTTKIA